MTDNVRNEDERLHRIKFLVEQSKLYSQFLASSVQPTPTENTSSGSKGVTDQLDSNKEDNASLVKTPPAKRAKRNSKSKPANQKSQPSITSFFKPPASKSHEQPKSIVVPLHPYQISALKWLTMLYQNGLNGILADEMGLGKTLEVITFIAFLIENGVGGPFLVLAPLSTLGNWCNEIEKFAPSITYTKYYGSKQERTNLRRRKNNWGQMILTTYEMVMADHAYLKNIGWKYIIVDEGHRLKNIDSKLMRVLKQFTSANRMLLTGTPLQNNLTELWALLNFLLPDVFTDLDIFHSWFESGEAHVDKEDESSLVTSLHDILRPFLLRRLKKDVGLNLPAKREYIIFTGLTELQQSLYRNFLDGTARNFVVQQMLDEAHDETNDFEVLIKQAKQELRVKSFSNLVMQLRLCCNSPHLFWYPDNLNKLESNSSKLQLLERLMRKLKHSGHKVLIFTQFTKMLDILEDWATTREYNYCRLDGSTSQSTRQSMIEDFADPNSDIDIFFLTTRSGGQGVNLVAADTVILFDSDWNPQQDLQAMDRVHRIGQTKPVLVLRLCVGNTVEQDLLERAATKLELNHLVIESGQFKGPSLSKGTNEEKIQNMGHQLEEHKVRFDKDTSVQILDNDLDKMLDRSIQSYQAASKDHKLTKNIYCVKSEV